jgi:hypothetical protein
MASLRALEAETLTVTSPLFENKVSWVVVSRLSPLSVPRATRPNHRISNPVCKVDMIRTDRPSCARCL